jgi:hypothetical protein
MILNVAVDRRLTNLLELRVNRIAIRNPDDWDLRVGDDEMKRAENSPHDNVRTFGERRNAC